MGYQHYQMSIWSAHHHGHPPHPAVNKVGNILGNAFKGAGKSIEVLEFKIDGLPISRHPNNLS